MKSIKNAFGAVVGAYLGLMTIGYINKKYLEKQANDDEYMERMKVRNPKVYETLLKYRR